jgi:hypothetical protein
VTAVAERTVDVLHAVAGDGKNDKPNVALNPPKFVAKKYPYLSNSTNVETTAVAALDAGEMNILRPDERATNTDEMSFKHIYGKMTYLTTVVLDTDALYGDVLFKRAICPVTSSLEFSLGESFVPSLLEYNSLPFSFWNGDLVYLFEFVGTGFHKTRVTLNTHYGTTSDANPGISGTQQNVVLYEYDYANPTFEVIVPWRSPLNVLKIPGGTLSDVSEYSTGEISLRVDAPLVVTDAISQDMQINVYIRGGENFKTFGLYNNAADYTPTVDFPVPDPPIVVKHEFFKDAVKHMDAGAPVAALQEESPAAVLATEQQTEVPTPTLTNDVRSVSDILKRFAPAGRLLGAAGNRAFDLMGLLIGAPTTQAIVDGTHIRPGPQSWFLSQFTLLNSDVRIKTFAPSKHKYGVVTNPMLVTGDMTGGDTGTLYNPGIGPIGLTTPDVGLLELQVPYLSRYGQLLIPRGYEELGRDVSYQATINLEVEFEEENRDGLIFVATGDAPQASLISRVPRLTISSLVFPHRLQHWILPESIRVNHDETLFPFTMLQGAFLERESKIFASGTVTDHIDYMIVPTSKFTDAELGLLGFPPIADPRRYVLGVTDVVTANLQFLLGYPTQVLFKPGVVGPITDLGMIMSPTTDVYVRNSLRISPAWTMDVESYGLGAVRLSLGVTTPSIIVPLNGVSVNQTVDYQLPVMSAGVEFSKFDTNHAFNFNVFVSLPEIE